MTFCFRLRACYAPGGVTEIAARELQRKISDRWAQPVIIDNRAGRMP